MKKVKLIIGTVNSSSLFIGEQQLEGIYERSYKPFLRHVHKNNLPITMYYSGELLSWLIDKHDGIQMLFNDIFKSRKIEILGGGYYSPLFSLIPRKDRVSQIELMTTEIRKRFGKRTRGMWITEKVWEPSMPMTMNYSGMEFTFLDEEFFENAGLFNGELYQPCVTEDQGKKVVIFPISNRLISQFFLVSPEEMLEQIIDCGSDKEERVITLLLNGEDLDFTDKKLAQNFEHFFELLSQNKKKIDVVLPGKLVREYGRMKKVYFGCVSPGDIGRWSGPVFREHTGNDEIIEPEKEIISTRKPVNTQSFFRHFLAKYPESNILYSRMIDMHQQISQVRGDKQRKKTAEIELYKSQNHSAFWHGGGSPGIYSAEARRLAYAALIEAEKLTRERSGFRTSVVKDDFDMDGLDEFVYRGLSMNTHIHCKGGTVFELDYFRTPHNYLGTMARHKEWYHDDDDVTDHYTRNTFIDHFFRQDEKLENFIDMSYKENGDFISGIYDIEKFNKERREVSLCRNGSIITRKNKFSLQLRKVYSFKRNIIIIDYEITNKSDAVLTATFGSEINLALSSPTGPVLNVTTRSEKEEKKHKEQTFTESSVKEMQIYDKPRKANIILESDIEFDLWAFPIRTKTGTGKVVEELYQSNCYVPKWNFSLAPGKSWSNRLQFRIERKSK